MSDTKNEIQSELIVGGKKNHFNFHLRSTSNIIWFLIGLALGLLIGGGGVLALS